MGKGLGFKILIFCGGQEVRSKGKGFGCLGVKGHLRLPLDS